MKKIVIGALVCAAVAGVVYYLRDPEGFSETVNDLKDKVSDAFGKAVDGLNKTEPKVKDAINQASSVVKQVGERTHNSMHEVL